MSTPGFMDFRWDDPAPTIAKAQAAYTAKLGMSPSSPEASAADAVLARFIPGALLAISEITQAHSAMHPDCQGGCPALTAVANLEAAMRAEGVEMAGAIGDKAIIRTRVITDVSRGEGHDLEFPLSELEHAIGIFGWTLTNNVASAQGRAEAGGSAKPSWWDAWRREIARLDALGECQLPANPRAWVARYGKPYCAGNDAPLPEQGSAGRSHAR